MVPEIMVKVKNTESKYTQDNNEGEFPQHAYRKQ